VTSFALCLAANLHGFTAASGAHAAIGSFIAIFFLGNFRNFGIRHDVNSRREQIRWEMNLHYDFESLLLLMAVRLWGLLFFCNFAHESKLSFF